MDLVRRSVRRHAGEAVASGESAAIVWGLPTYRIPTQAQLTRAEGHRRNGRLTHVSVAALETDDWTLVDDIPVTSLARTAVDVARRRPFIDGLIVADAVLRRGVPREHLEAVLVQQWNWPGASRAGKVVRAADGRAESAGESLVRGRILLLDLPVPDLQHEIWLTEHWCVRTDFYFKGYGLVGEMDGSIKYLGQRLDDDDPGTVLWREKQRRDLIEERAALIRWTWRQAHDPDPVFAARLRQALERGLRLRRLLAG